MKITFHDTLWNLKKDERLLRLKLLEVKPELRNKGALVGKLKADYSWEGLRSEGALDDLGGIWGADDLAWLSRYDGLRAFRLTALGAYVIGLENAYNPPPSGSTALLEVGVNQVIRHLSGSLQPADRLLLDAWAERIEADAWRLDRMLAIQAVERGQNEQWKTAWAKDHLVAWKMVSEIRKMWFLVFRTSEDCLSRPKSGRMASGVLR